MATINGVIAAASGPQIGGFTLCDSAVNRT